MVEDEDFSISLESLFVDPENLPGLIITDVLIDGQVPTFMAYEASPSPHLQGFTDHPTQAFYLITVKAQDNLFQVGEITLSFYIASKKQTTNTFSMSSHV